MRRRALLAGLAGLAGCSGLDTGETPERTLTPAPVPTPTSTRTPDPFDRDRSLGSATIGRSEVGGRTFSLHPPRFGSPEADVLIRFVEPATTEHPARLRAFLRGKPGTTVPARFAPFAPRSRFDPEDEPSDGAPAALFMVPTPGTEFARTVPEVELAHGGGSGGSVWRLVTAPTDWLPERVQIPADGSLAATFHLVADPDATAPPTGRYRPPAADQFRARLVAWDTDAPGPESDSRFARTRRLPSLPIDDPVVWFHEADPGTPVTLRPGAEQVTAPDVVSFTLVNHATDGASASDWACYRLDRGEWYEVGPPFGVGRTRLVPPGGRHRWRFEFAHDERDIAIRDGLDLRNGLDHRLGFLSGGTYAIVAGRTSTGEQPAALIELDAPSVTLQPTADARATRDGDRVTVRSEPPHDDGDAESAVLVLDRLPLGDATGTVTPAVPLPRLLPEQAMRSRGLRNTLPFADGAAQVRLRTTDDVVRGALRRVSIRAGGRRFRFDGDRFRVTVDSIRTSHGTATPGEGTPATGEPTAEPE